MKLKGVSLFSQSVYLMSNHFIQTKEHRTIPLQLFNVSTLVDYSILLMQVLNFILTVLCMHFAV